MRRLYFLLPDTAIAQRVTEELEDVGIVRHHIHAIAGISQDIEDLPDASIWQKSELAHGIEQGIGLGGASGLLGGLLAVTFPPAGLVLGGGAVVASALAGAGFGAVVSGLMKSHEHNHDLDRFQKAIERGEILLLVDVPKRREKEIKALILSHHPEVQIGSAKPKGSP